MKVENLSRYGKPLGLPGEARKKQVGIVFSAIREKFGLLGMAPFFVGLLAEKRRIRRNHADLVAKAREIGPEVAKEMVLLAALFTVTARRHGRKRAYDFLKDIFQRVAVHSMPAIYQIDELVQCEGDRFENFKKFNVAMFEAMSRERTWTTDAIVNEKDRLRINVISCANVVANGDDHCDFNFYRKGTAPPTEHLNR